jgi:hypothetical protein
MIVSGSHDVDAAEALGHLAHQHNISDQIAGIITERLAIEHEIPSARTTHTGTTHGE